MTADNPLRRLTTEEVDEGTPELEAIDDRHLVDLVAEVLTTPPAVEPDSFVLHAPLELMARTQLIPHVPANRRGEARARLASIATRWLAAGPPVPTPPRSPAVASDPAAALGAAIAAGSPDDADAALTGLATTVDRETLLDAVADPVLAHLGGAGHASIFLDLLGRTPPSSPERAATGRALLRDVAAHPGWTIEWVDRPGPEHDASDGGPGLAEALASAPHAGDPGSDFIHPTMSLVDRSGLAAELLAAPCATTSVDAATPQLLRVAAMSMLQDDPAHAPYGWTHCLTMPQATLAIAHRTRSPRRAVAVAATFVLGFRATQSTTPIDLGWEPPGATAIDRDLRSDAAPGEAAAAAWHLPPTERPALVASLATAGACHHDAHVAKYTLACLRAAEDDPGATPLYHAAAAYLVAWWRQVDG